MFYCRDCVHRDQKKTKVDRTDVMYVADGAYYLTVVLGSILFITMGFVTFNVADRYWHRNCYLTEQAIRQHIIQKKSE